MGGEKALRTLNRWAAWGSPPHGRGKGLFRLGVHVIVGITPAQAGKRSRRSGCGRRRRDHPRVGGEKTAEQFKAEYPQGSPPRWRGKGGKDEKGNKKLRITPAWAGKRPARQRQRQTTGDHPRVGGEKAEQQATMDTVDRITPAWAGKSPVLHPCGAPGMDHPRVGGEKGGWYNPDMENEGSPPRGRGKERPAERSSGRFGITPAWAGKRESLEPSRYAQRDHPRVGGEKGCGVRRNKDELGSPPRGRGKGSVTARCVPARRITPAWAGKSLGQLSRHLVPEDHPRVGGEKMQRMNNESVRQGSPPRGRGKVVPPSRGT